MTKKKCENLSDDYTVATILCLIHQEYFGFNNEEKIALFLITENDLLTLSGLPEITNKFINGIKDWLSSWDYNFYEAEFGWLLSKCEDSDCYPSLPAKLVESMQSGFVNKYFDECVDATEVEHN